MPVPQLHLHIWAQIITYLERPKPAHGTREWAFLHQHDLAVMMRVSKMHFELAAPRLYRSPIVADIESFFLSGNSHLFSTSFDTAVALKTKINCLSQVHRLHLIAPEPLQFAAFYTCLFSGNHPYKDIFLMMADDVEISNGVYHCWSLLSEYLSREHILANLPSTIKAALNLASISFGAYGDRSWNDYAPEIGDMEFQRIMDNRDKAIPQEKQGHRSLSQTMNTIGNRNHKFWRDFGATHICSSVVEGPLGLDMELFKDWDLNSPKKVLTIHAHDIMMPLCYLYPGVQVRVLLHYHQKIEYMDPFEMLEDHVMNGMEICESEWRKALEDGSITMEQIKKTKIDFYGFTGFPKSEIPQYNYGRQVIRELHEQMDYRLGLFAGKVKLHAWCDAPTCRACGFCTREERYEGVMSRSVG